MQSHKPVIAVVIPYAIYPVNSGGKKASADFLALLATRYNVHLVTASGGEAPPAGIIHHPVLGAGTQRYTNPQLVARVHALLQANRIKKIIFVQPYLGWLAMALKRKGYTFFVKSENIEATRWRSLRKWWWPGMQVYEKLAYAQAEHVFFITEEDRKWAVKNYSLLPGKTSVFTYGTHLQQSPSSAERQAARNMIVAQYGLDANSKILLFNGTLDYAPNTLALQFIIAELVPYWQAKNFSYHLLVCGSRLPVAFQNLDGVPGAVYAGFVEDIVPYFLGSDVFLNPVNEGGGIKTKLVDALAYGLTSVSTPNGAIGIPAGIAGEKLIIAASNEAADFAEAVMHAGATHLPTPPGFYEHFNYEENLKKLVGVIGS